MIENLWVSMVRNGCDQSGDGQSQKWIDGITDFLHADTNSERQKVDSMIFGWSW